MEIWNGIDNILNFPNKKKSKKVDDNSNNVKIVFIQGPTIIGEFPLNSWDELKNSYPERIEVNHTNYENLIHELKDLRVGSRVIFICLGVGTTLALRYAKYNLGVRIPLILSINPLIKKSDSLAENIELFLEYSEDDFRKNGFQVINPNFTSYQTFQLKGQVDWNMWKEQIGMTIFQIKSLHNGQLDSPTI